MEEEKKDLIQMKKDEEKTKKTSKIRELFLLYIQFQWDFVGN